MPISELCGTINFLDDHPSPDVIARSDQDSSASMWEQVDFAETIPIEFASTWDIHVHGPEFSHLPVAPSNDITISYHRSEIKDTYIKIPANDDLIVQIAKR